MRQVEDALKFFPDISYADSLRVVSTGADPDDADSAFALIESGAREGISGALLTVTSIIGGAPRALGTQMAVLADGRYCGHVSGGCVEAAVASAALVCIAEGRDATLRFGAGSPFVDVRLPCGGGIDVHVHIKPDISVLQEIRCKLQARRPFSVQLPSVAAHSIRIGDSAVRTRSGMHGADFVRHYHPPTRLVLIGDGQEAAALVRIGAAAKIPVSVFSPSRNSRRRTMVQGMGGDDGSCKELELAELPLDPFTAVAFLLHRPLHEAELIAAVAAHKPFYIGVMGSARTHAKRKGDLRDAGLSNTKIQSLHAPIGLFGPTRTANDLAISVLAEIAAARLTFDG